MKEVIQKVKHHLAASFLQWGGNPRCGMLIESSLLVMNLIEF